MKKTFCYENYPLWIVGISNLLSLSIYVIGAYVLSGFGIIIVLLYLLYCLFMEIWILKGSCVNCYYYGKVCGLGKGKLCSFFFKQGNLEKFTEKEVSFWYILPDFMIFIFPLIGGIILLIRDFNWIIVGLLVILLFLALGGTAIIRGQFLCKYCKQRDLGCPAEKLFNK
ncbi:MAG: hypothetical protein FJ150_07390 [Euryarchaeota archaeon]|nr:hypothetical protein [Euryarchaeota archaeon]